MVAGLGLAMLVWRKGTENIIPWLRGGLIASLLLILAEVFTGFVSGDPRAVEEAQLLLTGNLSVMFWLQVVGGVLLPLGILALSKSPLWLDVAAALAFLGVIAEKLWLLVAGQTFPWIPVPEGAYAPTWPEYLGLVGAIGLAALLYLAVGKLARMEEI
jgi:Ni/Fe-hydrogenase subunit HybB-like protein